ncbi:homoserine kinase [Cellulomonas gelida]|uniref:Homoserine kinase n=1 Tax=Cellulomonas gelida TaxID=1712 RepID=A0A4Y3KH60_9CELL|nr:homoserine kinase [Cellulomonas gelida]GEA83332.1 homoserine kinase [Cellulomonas gelida]GGL13680.1 homoserine kinase [Cellulomonas gelida]
MRLRADRVRVRVPATSANLGPGYDAMGVALALHDELEVRAVASAGVEVVVEGEGAGTVPDDERHLVVRAIRVALDHVGAPQAGLALTCRNAIPHGRGLGSSAAAVVAGIVAARGLISEPEALDDATVLALATQMEGHPDNAAPAILGGATVAWTNATGGVGATQVEVHLDIAPVVMIPPTHLSTKAARDVLPAHVPHADAAFQAGRSALLVQALGRRPDLLLDATVDKLHQEYRRAVMPDSLALVDALRARGVAAVVSGAGPTVLALARRLEDASAPGAGAAAGADDERARGTDADAAIAEAFGGVLGGWIIRPLAVDPSGARLVVGEHPIG